MTKRDCVLKLRALLAYVTKKVELVAEGKRDIFIFGAGNTAKLHAKCFDAEGIKPAGFLDNDVKKQGTKFLRGGVSAPNSLQGRDDVLVLICSAQFNVQMEISAQLENLGLSWLTVDEYVFAKRSDEILKCVELLDDESAETYTEIIECRLIRRLPTKKFISGDVYFKLPMFRMMSEREVFVDCGAFVGDTIEQYLFSHGGMFGKIFAFEPDRINYRAITTRVDRLNREWALTADKIQLVNAGVGLTTTEGVIQNHNGIATNISEDTSLTGDVIKIYALDDFFQNQRIDFLKADIESFELDMLRGVEKIIRRDLPKIAVCIYHNASDIYQILLWLNGLNLGYNFAVRHHSPAYFDTVLYAWK